MTKDTKSAITPEWLKADIFVDILRENVDDFVEVRSLKVTPAVATGENFMTVLLNAVVEIGLKDNRTQQKSFMVKTMPDNEQLQELLKDWKVFDKELTYYSDYIPEFEDMFRKANRKVSLGARTFKTHNPNAPKELVIMEDLRSKGYRNIKRQEGLDLEHTENALEKLAQLHAASACRFESKGSYPAMYNKCLCSTEDKFADLRRETANLLIDSLPLYEAEHLAEKLKEYAAVVPDQFQAQSLPDEFNVLNHGDCWSNNIMFQYNEDGTIANTCFIDFQMSRYGSPAHDLNYLLITSANLENKLKHFDYFVSYYHEKLTENLRILEYPKKFPSLRELHISLLRHGDWVYTAATTVMPILLLDPTEKASMDNVLDKGEEGNDLKKAMLTSSRYVAHMKQLLPWMDNRGLISYSV